MTHVILALALTTAQPAVRPPVTHAAPQARPPVAGPASQSQGGDRLGEAYYQFMAGRRLAGDGDVEAAVAAFRRALELDPASAAILAELATLYARQNRIPEATTAAEAALKNDPDNVDAHRLLGMIAAEDSARSDGAAAGDKAAEAAARSAIDHLERALQGATIDTASGIRMSLGRLYLRSKSPDKAVAVLQKMLVDEPGLPQGVALLAEAYTEAGRSAEAIDLLRDAATVDPDFHESLGQAYEKEKRWADAAGVYAHASANNPRDADLKTRWALALLNTDSAADLKQAADLLLDVTKTNPTSGWPLYLLARAQRELGELDAAEQTARRVLALSPTSVSGSHVLAQILAQRRDYSALIEAVAPMVDKLPKGREADQALLYTHLGFAYLETNRLSDSVAAFERARALNPEDRSVVAYLGQALNTSKSFDRALAVVGPERAANPADVRLARVEADALRGLGRFDDGVAVLMRVAEGPSATAEGVASLAELYAAAHRYAEAATVLKNAQRTYPGNLDPMFQYAAMLEKQELRSQAEQTFRDVIAKDPNHAPALNYLGYMLAEHGRRLEEALALTTRAVELDPYNGAYLDSLGWACFKLGRLEDAEKHVRAAALQLPRDSAVQDHWGDVLVARGRFAEAVAAWELALAGDGESIDRQALARKIASAAAKKK